jgi:hypothetical protein
VSLHPVKNISAEELCCLLKKAIAAVQLSGFVVVAVSADNNQVNCKTCEILSGTGKLELSIANPQLPDKRMVLLFDTVHILKCVRNNWLNQKDPEQTFRYPLFSSFLCKIASLLTSNALKSSNDELPYATRRRRKLATHRLFSLMRSHMITCPDHPVLFLRLLHQLLKLCL